MAMQSGITGVIPRISTVFVCCLGISLPALAAPPTGKTTLPAHPGYSIESLHASDATHASRLDLRPPAVSEFAKFMPSANGTRHLTNEPRDGADGDDESPYPAAIRSATPARFVSRAQAFADRFHREGLPIARLWESHSALVSLGLNQKGKPGLWLVQKTH